MSAAPPVLDVAPITDGGAGAADASLLAALDRACRDWGFFQITGHGIPDARLRAFDRAARGFFALPEPRKRAVSRSAENPWGWYDRELTKNTRDWKEIYDIGPERSASGERVPWPSGLPGFRAAMRAHYADCTRVAERLLSAIGVALGVGAGALREPFAGHASFLRLNHYPRCDDPAPPDADAAPGQRGSGAAARGHLGVNRHTDAGAITILYQDAVPALQVWHRERWETVPSLTGALVVNLGDMLQVWSNDVYAAPLHRVLAHRDRERFSAPFFLNPSYATRVAPLPGLAGAAGPPRYRPVPWAEFRRLRADGDYADRGREVQISDYRSTPDAPGRSA